MMLSVFLIHFSSLSLCDYFIAFCPVAHSLPLPEPGPVGGFLFLKLRFSSRVLSNCWGFLSNVVGSNL